MIKEYMQRTPVMFGEGALQALGQKLAEMGCKKAMCVFDDGVKMAGISKKAEDSLKSAGIDYIVFDRVLPDPPDYLMDEAGEIARKAGVDCVIGVGGGSSMDTAKAIAVLQGNPPPINNYMNLNGPPFTVKSGVRTILVPTSAGTGSEVTQMSIVTDTKNNIKVPIFTDSTLAVVDPSLCITAPPHVTANSGLDALAHASEAITAVNWNPYAEVLAVAAIERIGKYLPIACKNGSDLKARSELSLAANWAGIAFASTDVQIGHGAADSIAASYHTPHGLNCAWATPGVQELVASAVPDKVKLVGTALGVVFNGSESPEEIGVKTADACRALMREVGIKTFSEMGFERDVIVKNGIPYVLNSPLRFNCPVEINAQSAERLLSLIYDKYC
jgi:alcohol dehydrogenase